MSSPGESRQPLKPAESGPTNPEEDTVAAVATAPGRGGVGIIRISGPAAHKIGNTITGRELQARHAHYVPLRESTGAALDDAIALFFPAPRSFTGEDVVELQTHGGPVILDLVLAEVLRLGARQAEAGEFSRRAYLNDRLDLAQAEAIADLINSTTEQAARNASRSLQGAFSRAVDALVSEVTELRIYIEAAIDFPEEEVDFIADGDVLNRLRSIEDRLEETLNSARQGVIAQEGMKLVIAGRPNAGKSSLLNALAGQERAIVTAVEGTTRDVLRETIQIDGMPLHIVDTAGLRESADEVEAEGIRRAWLEIESADRILLVLDSSVTPVKDAQAARALLPPPLGESETPLTLIANKCDLAGVPPGLSTAGDTTLIHLSAKYGEGMELLRDHLKDCMGYASDQEGVFSARRRHLEALNEAAGFLASGREQLESSGAGELLAEDLRYCQQALGEITGAVTSDELLGRIFSSFCIGK